MNKEFKKSERLAQMVMDVLIEDYLYRDKTKSKLNDKVYSELINWTLKDYESCGFNMKMYRIYWNNGEKIK